MSRSLLILKAALKVSMKPMKLDTGRAAVVFQVRLLRGRRAVHADAAADNRGPTRRTF